MNYEKRLLKQIEKTKKKRNYVQDENSKNEVIKINSNYVKLILKLKFILQILFT